MSKPDFNSISQDLESELRLVGVYVDASDMRWIDPSGISEDDDDTLSDDHEDDRAKGAKKSSHIMMASGYIGAVAFSKRVQDPSQDDMDAEFRIMANQLRAEQYKDKKEEIRKSLEEL